MKYLKIKNDGLIETQALHLIGASTKRNDESKIGQFGSGNKYALAFFLRNDYEIKIFSGTSEIKIETIDETFRDQNFSVIHINGQRTSITTEMGFDWKLWQAVREIYCNAIDEGGAVLDFVNDIEPKNGETHFYLNVTREIKEFVANFDNYFSIEKNVLFECPVGKIVEKSGTTANIYRRGIRCFETQKTSTFDYDFHDIEINESRTVVYNWTIDEKLWDLIFRCTNKDAIRKILLNCSAHGCIEGATNDYSTISTKNVSKEFIEVLHSLNVVPREYAGLLSPDEIHNFVEIPATIYHALKDILDERNVAKKFKFGNNGDVFRETEETPVQAQVLKEALYFLNEVEFKIPYDIKMAIFKDKEILGCAIDHTIVLSDVCLEKGINETVNTIIEEFIHLKYSVKDETRLFQTAIITEFISYMKKKCSIVI